MDEDEYMDLRAEEIHTCKKSSRSIYIVDTTTIVLHRTINSPKHYHSLFDIWYSNEPYQTAETHHTEHTQLRDLILELEFRSE